MADNNRLIIIDGSSMLVTSYYGNLPRQILFEKDPEVKKTHYDKIMHNDKGEFTNAMFAMLRTLMKIFKDQRPSHIAFAFDKSRDTFRRNMYADYKANRGDTPEPLKEQFVNMEKLLEDAGLPVFYDDDYEADDIAGTIAKRFEKEIPTFIITKDHDYLQLVNEYTRLWLIQTKQDLADDIMTRYSGEVISGKDSYKIPDKAVEVSPLICRAEYGVWPYQIPDLKGIVGDSSDNIPGVKGVSSAAAPLLSKYDDLEGIYRAIDECPDEKAKKALAASWKEELGVTRSPIKAMIENREIARLSKDLATIRTDYPLDKSLDDLAINIDKDRLRESFEHYGFKSLMDKI
ncbi:5'-3' exonuclease [Butyrivibrio sp. MC2013]|uniref:5'-3' exonuclease n=1 Tax=Butyrivibrio sp. MC2013 TaxID=1280686 RepID=UPI00040B2742|nr:5'-3' exonuclease H3TH domain-containing protein [Butyrivibrio sp. MC2013]